VQLGKLGAETMKEFVRALLCACTAFAYTSVSYADEAFCTIADVHTTEQIKFDDKNNILHVNLTQIQALSNFTDVEQFASAARYLVQEAAEKFGSAQVEMWFYRAGTESAERLRDHDFYVAYTPDPSRLSFRDHVWESPFVDREDDLFDRVSASDVCVRQLG